jgi:hypothetical protein
MVVPMGHGRVTVQTAGPFSAAGLSSRRAFPDNLRRLTTAGGAS